MTVTSMPPAGTCPATEGVSTTCTCEGPKEDDCDAYAQMLAGAFLASEKFMGVFMHMDSASKALHIQNVSDGVRSGRQ